MRRLSPRYMVLAVAIFAIAILFVPQSPFSILPGFEGMDAGVEGATIAGAFARVDAPLPPGYSWFSSDPHNAILNKDLSATSSDARVRVEVGTPVPLAEKGQQVDYWVQDRQNYVHVTGEVVAYSLHVTVSAINTGTSWPEFFSGERVWVGLASLVWNRALQEQSPVSGRPSQYGQAWEAPLAVYITSFDLRDEGDHGRIDPSYSGRRVTLYSSPEQVGTVTDLLGTNINATFAGSLAPDSRMQRYGYFGITLTDWGMTTPYSGWFGTKGPVAEYDLKVYALKIGKFTFTNPDDTPWGSRPPDSYDPWGWLREWWDGVMEWFASPVNLFGTLLTLGIVLIVLALVFLVATGLMGPLRAAMSRSRRS
ncbi:MAG: hypothetical protein ACQXXL_03490 [Candidatus Methanosuratincola sp.]